MSEFHYDIVPNDRLRAFLGGPSTEYWPKEIIQLELDIDQTKICERSYLTEMECNGTASTATQFNYSFCLVHSQRLEDVKKAIPLLQALCRPGTDHRDFVYYLSLAHFRLGDYDKALAHAKRVLAMEPNNSQATVLRDAIQNKLKSEGALGMAIVTGGVAIGVGLVAIVAGALIRR